MRVSYGSTVQERLRTLIDEVYNGSVSAAAREAGLEQRTLANIVSGATKQPRGDALVQLSRLFGVSVDWLLTGSGEGPRGQLPLALAVEHARWGASLLALELPDDVLDIMRHLPLAIDAATHVVMGDKARRGVPAAIYTGVARECAGWNLWLAQMREQLGDKRVREALIANADSFAQRLAGVKTFLDRAPE